MGSTTTPSPFAPQRLPEMPVIDGVAFAVCQAGVRYANRTDLMLAVLAPGSVAGGVLTRSRTSSAAVNWCRDNLTTGSARALIVNSGNANTFTGKRGRDTVAATADAVAGALGCGIRDVYISSTGVIGEPLAAEKITAQIPRLAAAVQPGAWADAARAIMTTDTFAKLSTRSVEIAGTPVTISGFAKGAGMIAPDLATMLVYIFTDAPLTPAVAQSLVARHAATTFNCITIDSDTSTSDTVLLFATGAAARRGAPLITAHDDPRAAAFSMALHSLMLELAHLVVKDGEGLTKFVTIDVTGAESDAAAKRIAFSIANSPLVKTAIAGEDPNWGRIVMAVGKAGEAADRDTLAIRFGDITVAREGERAPDYDEATVARYMKNADIEIGVDLGLGTGRARVWTCDLTAGYVAINADYRS
jgi:glutamate N-acetyltransferase / amino-acid N-acetyltransferase